MNRPHRTARNVAIISLASFAQIVIQFLFQRVLAGSYGANVEADALAAALALPTLFAAIITGSLSYVLVPELVAKFGRIESEHQAWQLASYVGVITGLIGLVVSCLLWLYSPDICLWLYADLSHEQLQVTSGLLQILSIQVALTGWISWAQAIHHSRHNFLIPALGGLLGTSLSLVYAHQFAMQGIAQIAWAINLGSLVCVLVHILPLASRLAIPAATAADLLRLSRLFWPLVLGAAFLRIEPLVDRVLAAKLASIDPGSIAHINYAQRIMIALLAIGTSGLSVVAFPQLAQRFDGQGETGFAEHFGLAFRRLLLMVVPITMGVSAFAHNIVGDLLQQGEFTASDTRIVGWLMVSLMGMFVGASCGELLARGFYVLGDTRTPTVVGAVALAFGLAIKLVLFGMLGIWGIALGGSIYFVVSAAAMAWILSRRAQQSLFSGCPTVLLQSAMAAGVACIACYGIYQIIQPGTWLAAPMGAGIYFAVLLLLGNPDARQLLSALQHRLSFGRG